MTIGWTINLAFNLAIIRADNDVALWRGVLAHLCLDVTQLLIALPLLPARRLLQAALGTIGPALLTGGALDIRIVRLRISALIIVPLRRTLLARCGRRGVSRLARGLAEGGLLGLLDLFRFGLRGRG